MTRNRVRHHVNPLADRTEHCFEGFENDNPVIIDIGADRGEFSAKLLEKFKDTKNFIVCEIRKPLAERLVKKFQEHDNTIVFDGDMARNFESVVKPSVDRGVLIEEVYVNFPDPWFKERHKKRRVVNKDFIESVKSWISPKTRWVFQTDQKPLFDETVEVLENIKEVQIEYFDVPPHGATTKWEDAKVGLGSDIYRLAFYIK